MKGTSFPWPYLLYLCILATVKWASSPVAMVVHHVFALLQDQENRTSHLSWCQSSGHCLTQAKMWSVGPTPFSGFRNRVAFQSAVWCFLTLCSSSSPERVFYFNVCFCSATNSLPITKQTICSCVFACGRVSCV